MSTFQLSRTAHGRLKFVSADGATTSEGVVPVRAFPIASPDVGIALVDADGHELAWLESLKELPEETRLLLEEELRNREFLPEIQRIETVSSFSVPSTWEVETNRGMSAFVLKGEEDIRRIAADALMVADSHGVQYLIRDIKRLDRHSRKLLDRFL